MWEGRVVVPPLGQESVLIELHGGHPGISQMKSLARGQVWWPGMDQEIENMVKQCFQTVNKVDHLLPQHCYIHGVGRPDPGHDYM